MNEDDSLRAGVQIRRDMFGSETTDRQIAEANGFTRPMQEVVSRYCFGETWSRAGLARRERSMVTLAVLCEHLGCMADRIDTERHAAVDH